MEQVAWISIQITIAAAVAFSFGEIAKWLGFGPSYADAPKFYQLCATLGLVFVSLPFTLAVSHFAPILKERQRAARRKKRARKECSNDAIDFNHRNSVHADRSKRAIVRK